MAGQPGQPHEGGRDPASNIRWKTSQEQHLWLTSDFHMQTHTHTHTPHTTHTHKATIKERIQRVQDGMITDEVDRGARKKATTV